MGPSLEHLVDAADGQALRGQIGGGARGRHQLEAHLDQPPAGSHHGRLVLVLDRDEDRAAARQDDAGAELRLGEGPGEVVVDAHDLAGRFHLRS